MSPDTKIPKIPDNTELQNPAEPLDELYGGMVGAEACPANPDDMVFTFSYSIKPEMPEYASLESAGFEPGQAISRQQLLDLGYVFKNKLGDGEKGIFSGTIPDPNDPANTLDFTDRVLLTRPELEAIYNYQQSHPELYGLDGESLDDIRKDMLLFAMSAINEQPFHSFAQLTNEGLYIPINSSHSRKVGTTEDWEAVKSFLDVRMKEYLRKHPDQKNLRKANARHLLERAVIDEFAKEECADIYSKEDDGDGNKLNPFNQKETRGLQTMTLNLVRGRKLGGASSPFLDSGLVFRGNLDVNVFLPKNDGSNVHRRLNMASMHLFGGHPDFPGLSEMGGSKDQIYMTIGEYIKYVYPRDPEKRKQIQADELSSIDSHHTAREEVQRRLINRAKEQQSVSRKTKPRRGLLRIVGVR